MSMIVPTCAVIDIANRYGHRHRQICAVRTDEFGPVVAPVTMDLSE
jgi:hypothetical protein|tara:strand:- start:230 stop:367 length:138 start_codon:yes stop_codon:yes gene_type:complete